jgi:hypothetical protein
MYVMHAHVMNARATRTEDSRWHARGLKQLHSLVVSLYSLFSAVVQLVASC